MKSPVPLLMIGGGILVLVLVFGVFALQNPPAEPSPEEEKNIVESVVEKANDTFVPQTRITVMPTGVPGEWYEHQGLMFRIPENWSPSTSGGNIIIAQPEGSEVTSLPRLQIIMDKQNDSDYISPSQRYTNYKSNRDVIAFNPLISSAYMNEHPEDLTNRNSQMIQDRVAVLEKDSSEYTIIFQYKNNGDEKIYSSILESLRYR